MLFLVVSTIVFDHVTGISFYLPGVSPRDYREGEPVEVKVNSLKSLSALLPYDYYHDGVSPFCRPRVIKTNPQSLGEILSGDRIQSSLYSVKMKVNNSCTLLPCSSPAAANHELKRVIKKFEKMINDGYRGYMSIDNLPMFNPGVPVLNGRCRGEIPIEQSYPFQRGYALGVHRNCMGETLINNHIDFIIKYHAIDDKDITGGNNPIVFGDDDKSGDLEGNRTRRTRKKYRVVGFTGVPFSVLHNNDGSDCENKVFSPLGPYVRYLRVRDITDSDDLSNVKESKNGSLGVKVWWSYGVTWIEEPNVYWSTRWDAYLGTSVADSNVGVHWIYIVTSIMTMVCLLFLVTIMLMRALHLDFNRYNNRDPDDTQEEVGWKLVHADVFRPPRHTRLLSVLTGTGLQLLLVSAALLFFALLGFLSPAARGMLLTAAILVYVLLSLSAGYVCGRLLIMFNRRQWRTVFLCGVLFPGFVFTGYMITDIINLVAGASDAVPFLTLLTLLFLWIGISIPLTVLGASFAFRALLPTGYSALTNPSTTLDTTVPGNARIGNGTTGNSNSSSSNGNNNYINGKINQEGGGDNGVEMTNLSSGVVDNNGAGNVSGQALESGRGGYRFPVKVGRLRREIPPQRWIHSPPFIYVVPPLIPLSVIFLELKFILSSFWQGMVYYVFGFLTIVFIIWVVTCLLTTIVVIYYTLCYENYNWWWRSYIVPGALGAHLLLYCFYYYLTQTHIRTFSGTIIYFTYMTMMSLAYGMISGTIGFIGSLLFVIKIYSSIKLD